MHNMVVSSIGSVTDGGDVNKVDEVVNTLQVGIHSLGESAAQSQGALTCIALYKVKTIFQLISEDVMFAVQ